MSILSDFEDRIAGAVEGLFAGAFRSPVQPAELAKALSRAMDDGRQVGVSTVYAPTVFRVQLSKEDTREFGEFLPTLAGELSTYLSGYADEHGYKLPARPTIEFDVHDGLKLGRFRVAASLGAASAAVQAEAQRHPARPRTPMAPAAEMRTATADDEGSAGMFARATVTVSDMHHDIALEGDRMVVGRLSECQICLPDQNVSRQHAAFVSEGAGWAIEDLDSTNGTLLNGEPIRHARLRDGDVIGIGATKLSYHEPRR
ncbi:MAG: FhaA domain-containing protein [Coriobacteriia bacterium]